MADQKFAEGMTRLLGIATGLDVYSVDSAVPIVVNEDSNIERAIAFYEKRARLLRNVQKQGFGTLSEYCRFQEAQKLVKQHQEKMAAKNAQQEPAQEPSKEAAIKLPE